MPYLPQLNPEQTAFPKAQQRDLATQVRMIAELYRRQYPATDYYALKFDPTPTSVASGTQDRVPSGVAGGTTFDPVWGENLPAGSTEWKQGHGTNGVIPTTDQKVWYPAQKVHSRRQRIDKEVDLKPYGFNKVRKLLIHIPLSMLDDRQITVKHGDKFIWNGVMYSVDEFNKTGYWKNTDITLYMTINAEQLPMGS
jgi:hypothetical protein